MGSFLKSRSLGEMWLGKIKGTTNLVAIKRVKNSMVMNEIEVDAAFYVTRDDLCITNYQEIERGENEIRVRSCQLLE